MGFSPRHCCSESSLVDVRMSVVRSTFHDVWVSSLGNGIYSCPSLSGLVNFLIMIPIASHSQSSLHNVGDASPELDFQFSVTCPTSNMVLLANDWHDSHHKNLGP